VHPEWEIHVSQIDGEWRKGVAVAAGVDACSTDIVVVADADVWCDGLDDAVAAVETGATWAVPHRLVHRLDRDATASLVATGAPDTGRTERSYVGHAGGGLTVMRRATYRRVPIDPRFVGWGQEDDAHALALRTLTGLPWRGRTDLIHLWHPPQPRQTRSVGSPESQRLLRRYKTATRSHQAMYALVAEARSLLAA
jgi:hypothetical protein